MSQFQLSWTRPVLQELMCTLPAAPGFLNPYEVRLKKGDQRPCLTSLCQMWTYFLKEREMGKKVYLEKNPFFFFPALNYNPFSTQVRWLLPTTQMDSCRSVLIWIIQYICWWQMTRDCLSHIRPSVSCKGSELALPKHHGSTHREWQF